MDEKAWAVVFGSLAIVGLVASMLTVLLAQFFRDMLSSMKQTATNTSDIELLSQSVAHLKDDYDDLKVKIGNIEGGVQNLLLGMTALTTKLDISTAVNGINNKGSK